MLRSLPFWANVATFIAARVAVWFAGARVARYAHAIEARTGAGEALVGVLLLGFITALPELAVTATASYSGNAKLAVNKCQLLRRRVSRAVHTYFAGVAPASRCSTSCDKRVRER